MASTAIDFIAKMAAQRKLAQPDPVRVPPLKPSTSVLPSVTGVVSGALLSNKVNDALQRMHSNVESLEGQLQELRSNFNPEVLVECLTAVTDENRQLREENDQLRAQVLEEQANSAALAERFASLAERVSHVVLDKLISGG